MLFQCPKGLANPIQDIQNRFSKLQKTAKAGMANVGFGVAGVLASVVAITSALSPAIAQSKALGEVAALGVSPKGLEILSSESLRYASEYGENATAFVRASYDIQSAIDNLNPVQLSSLTRTSAILAKATKSDVATITGYMGTMYGIFKQQAKVMGTDNFALMLADQTASAVRMYKTTGSEMEGAFSATGSTATAAGIQLSEQMAILGTLQATLGSGSEAGTQYVSFLSGVGKAQKALGLQFTDSAGRMLPMVEILGKIQGKFGAIDTVAKADLLQKAFGRKEAVKLIQSLSKNVGKLTDDIAQLETNSRGASEVMAKLQVDKFDKLKSGVDAARISLGNVLINILTPIIDKLSHVLGVFSKWVGMFPNLARVVGIAALSFMALSGAIGAVLIVQGIWMLATVAFTSVMAILTSPITLLVVMLGSLAVLMGMAAYKIYANWDNIKASVGNGIESLKQGIGSAMDWIYQKISPVIELWEKMTLGFKSTSLGNYIFGASIDSKVEGGNGALLDPLKAEEINKENNFFKTILQNNSVENDKSQGNYIEKVEINSQQEISPSFFEHALEMSTS